LPKNPTPNPNPHPKPNPIRNPTTNPIPNPIPYSPGNLLLRRKLHYAQVYDQLCLFRTILIVTTDINTTCHSTSFYT